MCEKDEIKSFAIMDIEATGLPEYNFGKVNITEISIYACLRRDILWYKNDKKIPRNIHKLTLCFNPHKLIDPKASELSGLYNDILEPENKFNENAGNLIINFFQHLQHPVCLVAHNGMGYDFPILKKTLEKINVDIPDYILCLDSYPAIKRIDEIQLAREMFDNIDNTNECITEKTKSKDIDDGKIKNKENLNESINTNNNVSEIGNLEQELLKETTLESKEKINWQKINETTPKRTTQNKNIKLKQEKRIINDESTPQKISNEKNEPKSRRSLFSPSCNETPSSSNSKPQSPYQNNHKTGYYKLSSIYDRIFGKRPDVVHHAEDDVYALQQIILTYGEDFVQYADENAIKFSDIVTKGFR